MKNSYISNMVKDNWGFMLFVVIMLASRSSVADWYVVPTGSMQPTIVEGDRIFVNKLAYQLQVPFTNISLMEWQQPKHGEIVVFESEAADNRLVKRIIGLPGDKVEMRNNRLIINGQAVKYLPTDNPQKFTESLPKYAHPIQFKGVAHAANFDAVVVPADHYLVLGDNRNNSADSRFYGFVPKQELQGRAVAVITSLDEDNYYLPRGGRNFKPLI